MKRLLSFAAVLAAATAVADAPRSFVLTAERIAVDNVTKAAVATGHVVATSHPIHLRSEMATRDTNGVVRFSAPTELTNCTNHPGICHWSLKGEVEYQNAKYICGRNLWLEFYEIPVFYLPYFYYPLDGECAFRIMPGYTERWGAYIMMKYGYHLLGDRTYDDNTWWLKGNTRFDLRWKNGIALGETLKWNLGDFGTGHFKIYYAWDEDYDRYERHWVDENNWHYENWSSPVKYNRYRMELAHRWNVTERDIFRVRGQIMSDSMFATDFFRDELFSIRNEWMAADNEIAWEHNENAWGAGVSVSGPLNKFYSGSGNLPDIYFDVSPRPLFDTFVNYETENRLGYLFRQPAEYGQGDESNPYSFAPGIWADYKAVRFDTYHRLTAPFKTWDILSVVPRVGYRGTGWSRTGDTDLTGQSRATDAGSAWRSIVEGGATFSARGKAWITETCQHVLEPYFDVLAQKAWYAGLSDGERPYIFDSVDGSVDWQDQFAGRGRNLPYTYYGVTPGLRNGFDTLEENGTVRTVFDFDVYAALQFNHASWYGRNRYHKLAEAGSPNYGKNDAYVTPGFRLRWMPSSDITLGAQLEYDPDENAIALASLDFSHAVTKDFSYTIRYSSRNYRAWDYSSSPYDPTQMTCDDFNLVRYDLLSVGFKHQPLSWFAWNPFLMWDCREGELDRVGAWFDYLTDCLGFRLQVEYENEYTRIDGSVYEKDTFVGFYVYLRGFGMDGLDYMGGRR